MNFKNYDKKSYETDTASQLLFRSLNKFFEGREDCYCYYRQPIYFTEGNFRPSLVIVDREYGILIFKAYKYSNNEIEEISENFWTVSGGQRIENDFINFEEYCYQLNSDIFQPKYKLSNKLKIHYFACFPFITKELSIKDNYWIDHIFYSDILTTNIFSSISKKSLNDIEWKNLRSIVQKANTINKSTSFKVQEPLNNLREAIIFNEQRICLFDEDQEEAAMQIPDGAERIRGLAGTGKTVILAMKAARIHAEHPNDKVLYTFYTQSLYNQIKNLISKFYRRFKNDEPNWENLKVLHAWGSKEKEGVYRSTSLKNGLMPLSFSAVRFESSPFGKACELLLDKKINEEYDCVLIDEAQDLPVEFFKVIEKITKQPKRIVFAYDDLQTIGDIRVPGPDILFGVDEKGESKVKLDKDYILRKSYRNHGKVLHTAVALGFGIYNTSKGLCQIAKKDTWKSIGYNIKSGDFNAGETMAIERPPENSPNNIDALYPGVEILQLDTARDKDEEIKIVSTKIIELVKNENVRADDIIVIELDTKSAKYSLGRIQEELFEAEINGKMPGIIDNADDFFIEDNVTLTTVRRAKGNEAPIIFVMGIDKIYDCSSKVNERIIRNQVFISLTRSKGWCFISGISGANMDAFLEEYKRITHDYPILNFKYPTEDELKQIATINYISQDKQTQTEYYSQIEMIKKLTTDENLIKLLPDELKEKLKSYSQTLD